MSRVIIFDLDNTFYDYQKSHESGIKKVFESQEYYKGYDTFSSKYELTKNKIHEQLNNSPSKHSKLIYFKKLFQQKASFDEILRYENLYWEEFIKSSKINKETINILRDQKSEKDFYALFTNQNTNIQLKKISKWNLDFFDLVVTSEEVGYEKPNKYFYEYVTKIISEKLNNKTIYAIGDDYLNDIKYWQNEFNATSYLIDNSLDDKTIIDSKIVTIDGNVYELEKEIVKTSFDIAIRDIFKSKVK